MQAWLTLLAMPATHTWLTPAGMTVGSRLSLTLRHRQRWSRDDVTRVILGSDPEWADLVLIDEPLTIRREHARFYLNHAAPLQSDFRAMKDCPVLINGRAHPPFEWVKLEPAAEIQLSHYRFRYEFR